MWAARDSCQKMLWVRLTEMFVMVGFVRMNHLNFSFRLTSHRHMSPHHPSPHAPSICIFTPFSRHSLPVSHILLCPYTPLLPGHGPSSTCGLILTCALLRRAEERPGYPKPVSIQRAAAAADASSEGASGGGEREAASPAAKGTCQREAEFAGHAKRCTEEDKRV